MNHFNAYNSLEYQKIFYREVSLEEQPTESTVSIYQKENIGTIINYGQQGVMQCGIGDYKIPHDFMMSYNYDTCFLHFGIVYRGVAYSVVENTLTPTVVPSSFLSKEKVSGGVHCWKAGQQFKGTELSIEYNYLVNELLPILGKSEKDLDFLKLNIRYTELPEEMISVIKRVECNIEKYFMTDSLLKAFCIEFLNYLFKEENIQYFDFEKNKYRPDISVGKRKIQLSVEDMRAILNVHDELKDYATSFPSIYELSKRHNISEQKLKAGFRKLYGQTLWDYSNYVRMNKAIEYLGQSKLKVSEIAIKVGYSSESAFLRSFKSYCGISPHQFRLKLKQVSV